MHFILPSFIIYVSTAPLGENKQTSNLENGIINPVLG